MDPEPANDRNTVTVTPPPVLTTTLAYRYRVRARGTRFRRLAVRGVPAGAMVTARCTGRGFGTRRVRLPAPGDGTVPLTDYRRRLLRPGARLEIRVTKPGLIAQVYRVRIRKHSSPVILAQCLPPGASLPQDCPAVAPAQR